MICLNIRITAMGQIAMAGRTAIKQVCMQCKLVQALQVRMQAMNLNEQQVIGSGHPQNAPEYRNQIYQIQIFMGGQTPAYYCGPPTFLITSRHCRAHIQNSIFNQNQFPLFNPNEEEYPIVLKKRRKIKYIWAIQCHKTSYNTRKNIFI